MNFDRVEEMRTLLVAIIRLQKGRTLYYFEYIFDGRYWRSREFPCVSEFLFNFY